jgi:type II secretory pathway pseudopilin PulG
MTYHIARDGAKLGTFSEEQLPAAVENGTLLLTDLAWTEGMAEWEPLSALVNVEVLDESGAPVPPTPTISATPLPPRVSPVLHGTGSTSGMAVASLVCGIASLLCGCLTGLPAIILGAISLSKIGKSNGALTGRGMAITGLVLGSVLALLGTAVLASLAMPAFAATQSKAKMMQAQNNARQIALMLRMYASDNNGNYPDSDQESRPQTSNEAFRLLFKRGIANDERPFSAPLSPYVGDNNIGFAPEYYEALTARENHWAMTKGLSDSASGLAPLVFENANESASWPPTWNADAAGRAIPGRAWQGGKIIIVRNDNSVEAAELESRSGYSVGLKQNYDGKDLFTQYLDQGEYLDVQR